MLEEIPCSCIPEISIIIPVHNQWEYTKICLESIRRHTLENHEIIIVDNGSEDATGQYLKGIPHIRVIHNQENLGFAKAINQGLGIAQGKYVIVLNNDCIVSSGWIPSLLWAAENLNIGIVGVMSNFAASPQLLKANLKSLEDIPRIAQDLKERCYHSLIYTTRVIGLCMLIKRDLINQIGGFDPRFGLGTFEDDDFCLRSVLAGYKNVIAQDVFIYHFGSMTFRQKKNLRKVLLRENWQKFKEKWGLPLDMPFESKAYKDFLDNYLDHIDPHELIKLQDKIYVPF